MMLTNYPMDIQECKKRRALAKYSATEYSTWTKNWNLL